MRIGYPCINRSVGCRGDLGFRLSSYSAKRARLTIKNNLDCLGEMLDFNVKNGMRFFRISSQLIPFASHPVFNIQWRDEFDRELSELGSVIEKGRIRISMHPDQFVVLNSPREDVVERSVKELEYHANILDSLGLGPDSKIQIHVGGVFGDMEGAMNRFAENYDLLHDRLRSRIVIENDDVSYGLLKCLELGKRIGVPVIFDAFHDSILPSGIGIEEILREQSMTWRDRDGIAMVDWSCQEPGSRRGRHADHIDMEAFREFLSSTRSDFDLMLEIRDKERSALEAVQIARSDPRFVG